MKLKSIKPTNEYRHVEFRELVDNWRGRYVLSPIGFQPVLQFGYIKSNATVKFSLSNGHTLLCDPQHRLLTRSGIKFAKDIVGDDVLIGYDNQDILFDKADGPVEDLYDIQLPAPHWYYTAGVISHNSVLLCNNAFTCIRNGLNVLYVTFELSAKMTAMRILGPMSGMPLDSYMLHNASLLTEDELDKVRKAQDIVKHKATQYASKAQLVIYDLPPGECSVDNIHTIIDVLRKTRSWAPDVVILDYLELMTSRRQSRDEDEYMSQKRVSTEVRGLAKKENVLIFTATQSNRSSVKAKEANIDLDKSAESYGKNMASDYVISINQTEEEYKNKPAQARLWIAKNRNGQKFVSVTSNIWYDKMIMTEVI